jgi:quercetin dioxygenase-like cupin family protein
MTRRTRIVGVAAVCGLALVAGGPSGNGPDWSGADGKVTERPLLDNDRVLVVEYTFPAGFRGDEHAAIANEFAYVIDGEFTVVTRGQGRRVVRAGEVEYASKGTVHNSLNESRRPARVLVVYLKGN